MGIFRAGSTRNVDQKERKSSVDPRHRFSVTGLFIWVQEREEEGKLQVSHRHFL